MYRTNDDVSGRVQGQLHTCYSSKHLIHTWAAVIQAGIEAYYIQLTYTCPPPFAGLVPQP